jgi:uncharacterized ion transporter superfamily protein YfcC
VNPFQVVIAQKVADLPPQSGLGFRVALLLPALAIWIWGTMRYAKRGADRADRAGKADRADKADKADRAEKADRTDRAEADGVRTPDLVILATVLLTFALFIIGARRWGWDFEQFSGVFFLMGVAAGIIGRLGVSGTADAFVEGFKSMAFAALLIGFARGIYVVLNEGQIVDTIVQGIFAPLADLPLTVAALGMMGLQAVVHIPVPSTSGQAVLTMPVLVPLSDLLGLSRQVTVLAYQYGAGLCELLTPTNGALMAMLAATGVRYDDWLRFALRLLALLVGLGAVGLLAAIAIDLR